MKRNYFTPIALIVLALSFSSFTSFAHTKGNGKIVKEERCVPSFNSVTTNNGIELVETPDFENDGLTANYKIVGNALQLSIQQDSFESVTVEADENVLPFIQTEVKDGNLNVYVSEPNLEATEMNVYVTEKHEEVF
jgi:hypothetical protein